MARKHLEKSMRVLTVFLVGGLKLEKAYWPYYE